MTANEIMNMIEEIRMQGKLNELDNLLEKHWIVRRLVTVANMQARKIRELEEDNDRLRKTAAQNEDLFHAERAKNEKR